jgi:hypothetical protein
MNEYTDGLRALADFLDAHPDVLEDVSHSGFDCGAFFDNKTRLAAFAKAVGGQLDKGKYGGYLEVAKRFGPHKLTGNVAEDLVCERIVVGTETVEVPDPEAPKVTIEREIVEWKCPPILNEVDA